LITADKRAYKRYVGDPSPIPLTSDVWTESDRVAENLEYMLRPYLLYETPITWKDIHDNTAIEGFEPYYGILRRRL
jgi:hypothetical protein